MSAAYTLFCFYFTVIILRQTRPSRWSVSSVEENIVQVIEETHVTLLFVETILQFYLIQKLQYLQIEWYH